MRQLRKKRREKRKNGERREKCVFRGCIPVPWNEIKRKRGLRVDLLFSRPTRSSFATTRQETLPRLRYAATVPHKNTVKTSFSITRSLCLIPSRILGHVLSPYFPFRHFIRRSSHEESCLWHAYDDRICFSFSIISTFFPFFCLDFTIETRSRADQWNRLGRKNASKFFRGWNFIPSTRKKRFFMFYLTFDSGARLFDDPWSLAIKKKPQHRSRYSRN